MIPERVLDDRGQRSEDSGRRTRLRSPSCAAARRGQIFEVRSGNAEGRNIRLRIADCGLRICCIALLYHVILN